MKSRNDKKLAVIFILVCTVFISVGQLLWKLSASRLSLDILALVQNRLLVLGFVAYLAGSFFLIMALRLADLSVVYPFFALSFVWVAILSLVILGEKIYLVDWFGISSIIVGISMIGRGYR